MFIVFLCETNDMNEIWTSGDNMSTLWVLRGRFANASSLHVQLPTLRQAFADFCKVMDAGGITTSCLHLIYRTLLPMATSGFASVDKDTPKTRLGLVTLEGQRRPSSRND